MRIELLSTVKWEFIGLERELKKRVARRIRKLHIELEAPDVHRIAGTDHLFRLRVGECRVLFHRKADVITLLSIGARYADSQIEEFVTKRRAKR